MEFLTLQSSSSGESDILLVRFYYRNNSILKTLKIPVAYSAVAFISHLRVCKSAGTLLVSAPHVFSFWDMAWAERVAHEFWMGRTQETDSIKSFMATETHLELRMCGSNPKYHSNDFDNWTKI